MHAPPATYLVEPGFWAGSYPGAGLSDHTDSHIAWLRSAGIGCIIDLSSPDDQLPPYAELLASRAPDIRHCPFPMRDGAAPSPALMAAVLACIASLRDADVPVYVHCWGGVGRTGTVVACWYMRRGLSAIDALRLLTDTRQQAGYRRPSPDYHAQLSFVSGWQPPTPADTERWERRRSVFRGVMLGAALGNALGVTNDMRPAKAALPVTTIQGGGLFDVAAGEWTDETAMLLCVAESMIQMRGFDARDVAERFLQWWRDGYMTCSGRVFEVGNTTRMALFAYQQTGDPYQGLRTLTSSGNGSVTRIGPIGLSFAYHDTELLDAVTRNSMITHGTQTAIDGCRYTVWLFGALCRGVDKRVALSTPWPYEPLAADVMAVAAGSYRSKTIHDIRATIDVSDTIEAALWALWHCDDYETGALALANLGGLTEACGQLYGTLAGAVYGEQGLPTPWLALLHKREYIAWVAEELLRTSWKNFPAL